VDVGGSAAELMFFGNLRAGARLPDGP